MTDQSLILGGRGRIGSSVAHDQPPAGTNYHLLDNPASEKKQVSSQIGTTKYSFWLWLAVKKGLLNANHQLQPGDPQPSVHFTTAIPC